MTARTLTIPLPALGTTLPYALPIGISAFLLFSVQPLIGRLALPVFGGTPAVWATSLFFFQTVLLLGYLYAHVSVTRFGSRGPVIHLALAALAVVSLVVGPTQLAALRMDGLLPVIDLVRILLLTIGLPAFVLTATTPLVSGWLDAVREEGAGGDPYWLYALSNAGSLLALLAYPLIIEPRLGLGTQREAWAVAYAVLVALLALAAARSIGALGRRRVAERAIVADSGITWSRRGRWLLLAAVPSGLLSAVTMFITTDFVAAPLLWVAPLAIYLASFIVAFSPRGGRLIGLALVAAPAAITLLWVPYGSAGGWPILVILALELGAFAVVATALHGRLAQDRPASRHLTEFYLVLSIGGALAAAFVALFAPLVFPAVWEYPILLVAALAGLAVTAAPRVAARRTGRGLDFGPFFAGFRGRVLPYAAAGVVVAALLVWTGALASEAAIRWLLVGGLILLVGSKPWFLTGATAFVLALATFVLQPPAEFRDRTFFGVTEVQRLPDEGRVILFHGTTVHGAQLTDPELRRVPTAYFSEEGPAGDLFAVSRDRADGGLDAGVVGLGAGTMAAYIDAETTMTFYEIDPVVIEVASDPRYFTYLSDAPRTPKVHLGDGRLLLEETPADAFDILFMDAFSSDSIPVHLLTVEAIRDAARTVRDGGVIAFQVSNRYYDISPAVAAGAASAGLTALERAHSPSEAALEAGATPSHWVAASSDPETIAALRARGWTDARVAPRPFTDDYADLLAYLKLGG
jgi:hypothetical protein